MVEPLTYEVLKAAQTVARAQGWKLSNCFLLPAELRRRIDAGLLSLQQTENGLFLMENAGSFDRCYYYLPPTGPVGPLHADRELVVEFPFTGEPNPNQQLQIARLLELGFELARESGLMSCSPDALIPHKLPEAQIHSATEEEIPEILDLLYQAFDPRFAFLPTAEELRTAVVENRLFAASREGHVAAALHAGFEKTVAIVHHVAVDESFRGCGLGKCLLDYYHRRFAGQATAYQHWVDLHNVPALAMYKSFGYGFSLRKANEYIRKPYYQTERKETL